MRKLIVFCAIALVLVELLNLFGLISTTIWWDKYRGILYSILLILVVTLKKKL